MIRRTVPVAALTAAALVLLAACGGGGGDSDTIRGASPAPSVAAPSASGLTTPTTPSASATGAGVRRPAITFPAGARTVYEDKHTGDPVKDAVLADEAHANDATYAAILEGRNRTPAIEFYYDGLALSGAVQFVQRWLDKDDTWVGTIRFFHRRVTMQGKDTAVVILCWDDRQAFVKHRKTGKVDKPPTTAEDFVLYNERFRRSPQGVWVLDSVLSKVGAKECQP